MISSNPSGPSGPQHYEFYARLFLHEPDETSLAVWQQDRHLAPAFPASVRDLSVEFTRLFSLNVFPYASVFMDEDAFMNSETTARVDAAYQKAHFEPDPALPLGAPDHFGLELAFAGYLFKAGREAEAKAFVQRQVLPWAGIFLHAVEKNAQEPLYRLAAQVTLEWLARNDVIEDIQGARETGLGRVTDDEDDLEGVVSKLLIPATAGIFLSKDEIASLARQVGVPLGFGDRALMLKSLFRAAGEYGRIGELLRLLQAEAYEWIGFYAQESQQSPAGEAIAQHWLKRAAATLGRLKTMEQTAMSEIQ